MNPASLEPHTAIASALRSRSVAGALILLLCACTSLPQQDADQVPFVIPSTWSASDAAVASDASSLATWWLRFDDPLLSRLIVEALTANHSVRGAQAALLQARALRDVTAAALWPRLDSLALAQRSKSGGNPAVNNFRAGFDAAWELDIFGANRSALDAGDATVRASSASLGDVQVSIAAEVALDYITLRGAQAQLAIAADNLASQLATLQMAQWRLQAGLIDGLESEQARTLAEQTRARLPALQSGVEQIAHALAVLTGQPPADLASVLATPAPVPQAAGDLVLAIPAETLRQRPDVRAAEYQVSAAAARVGQAEAARLPNFQLGGSLGLSALTLGALGNSAAVASALLASVSLPVFDGGALRAQVRAQQAALDAARVAYQATVLTALKDVEDALVALHGNRERLSYLQRAAVAAASAARLARQRYGSGLIDFQTVLDTQRSQLAAQDSVASAGAELAANHVRLYKALGGGWRSDGGEALPSPTPASP
ncbi:MAG: efflux transporter outer membrane subunit [Candidatus Accumulibacter propinquus]|jgi:multidrug efflux system outer membrane protein|uniref:efflux transporter outer membrane subunit n=1 Tax=Candidatus Accumulibacter propinquus TaxID=2954380 RepID=UPI002FC33394